MSTIHTNSSPTTEIDLSKTQLPEQEQDRPKRGNLLMRVAGSTINRIGQTIAKNVSEKVDSDKETTRLFISGANEKIEAGLEKNSEILAKAGNLLGQGAQRFNQFNRNIEEKMQQGVNRHHATVTAARQNVEQGLKRIDAQVEASLTRHNDALKDAGESAKRAKQSISSSIDAATKGITEEAKVGVDAIRKSVAYRAAVDELRLELEVELRKNQTLSPEQKQELEKLATGDLDEIRDTVTQRIEGVLVDNENMDITRSAIRPRISSLAEDAVNSVSQLTQDLRSARLTLSQHSDISAQAAYSSSRTSNPNGAVARSAAVNFLGGQYNDPLPAPAADLPPTSIAQQPAAAAVAQSAVSSVPVESIDASKRNKKAVAPLTVVPEPSTSDDITNAIEGLKSKQLVRLATELRATGNSELNITGSGRMSKANLQTAILNAPKIVEYLTEHQELLEQVAASADAQTKTAATKKQEGARLRNV